MAPPLNETWAAMEALVDLGLVRSIGVSNFSPEKIEALLQSSRIKPAVNQVRVPSATACLLQSARFAMGVP